MRKGLIMTFASLWFVTLMACQKSSSTEASAEDEAVTETTEDKASVDQKKEASAPATCRTLNIPTYDLLIKDLSALRCDSCHNETFAWKGIILTQYDAWKTYVKPIRNRIFYNLLTQPLEPGEQELFLAWIDNGLPRTDADCANLQ